MDAAPAVDGPAQRVHHPAQKAVAHGHAGGLQRTADHAAGADLLTVAKEDTAQLPPAQVLNHTLYAGIKDKYLSILSVLQSAYGGNLAVHRQHLADLLGHHGQRPVRRRLAHQGQQVVLPGLDLAEVVGKLPNPSVQGPVVHVGSHLQPEAGAQRLVLLPVKGNLALVSPAEKVGKALELGLGGFTGAAQLRGQAASSASHCFRPPPPGLGIDRRGRSAGPAVWWPPPPDGAAPVGRSAESPPGRARPQPGHE